MVIPSIQGIPNVVIHVRHSASCPQKAKGEFYKACKCKKHLRWHHKNKLYRVSAKTRTWEGAERARRVVEAQLEQQLFPGHVAHAAVPGSVSVMPGSARVDTKEMIARFLKTKSAISQGAQSRYVRELQQMLDYLEARSGCQSFPDQITSDILNDYQATWTNDLATQAKTQQRMKGFLTYLYDERVLDRVPKLAPIKKKSRDDAQKLPLSDEQYAHLLQTIPTVFSGEKATRVRGLIQFMRYTGLAIQDACTVERDRLIQDADGDRNWRVVVKRQKTGVPVSNLIPLEVAEEILAVPNANPDFIFWNKKEGTATSAANLWGKYLREVLDAAGLQEFGPHNLRHTFSVGMLSDGVAIEDVSKMLGHSSVKTTETYYAAWVKKRQDNLDNAVKATWKKGA